MILDRDGTGTFLGMGKIDAAPSFASITWDLVPAWDPNADFYRPLNGNLLHNDAGDLGINVGAGVPHARDVAVTDDIEKDPRPGAIPAHTDRGADQIEAGVSTAAGVLDRCARVAERPQFGTALLSPAAHVARRPFH